MRQVAVPDSPGSPGSPGFRRVLGWILAVVFLLALILGAGPGILLVNGGGTVHVFGDLELPSLYAWGILWYLVEAVCIILASVHVWREPDEE